MARTAIIFTLALSVVCAADHALYGQESGLSERTNPYRLTRTRPKGSMSTHSQTEKSPRYLGYRGIHAAVVKESISRSSTSRQQAEYHRRFVSTPEAIGDLDSQHLRSRFAEQSNLSAATDQRGLRSLQVSENRASMGQRTQARTSSALDALRAQLLARGMDPALADQLTYNRSARSTSSAMQHASGPQLNQVRAELQASGVDPRQVNRELVQVANSRAFNQRFENRTQANGAPNYEQLRSRISRTGADPRTFNARLGRTLGTVGGSESAARLGSSRTRRR